VPSGISVSKEAKIIGLDVSELVMPTYMIIK